MSFRRRRGSYKSQRKAYRKRMYRDCIKDARESYLLVDNLDLFTTLEEARNAFLVCSAFPGTASWLIKTLPKTESPIERIMVFAFPVWGNFPEAQFRIGKYRLDFAFPKEKVAVELDGQEFHASADARTRDASRDRFFMEQGWKIIRFTGREVWRDANKCAQEVRVIRHLDSLSPGDRKHLRPPANTGEGSIIERLGVVFA